VTTPCPHCGLRTEADPCEWCGHALEEPALHAPRTGDRLRALLRGSFRFDPRHQACLFLHIARWILLGALVGVIGGLAGAAFLVTLGWVTDYRLAHGWIIALLPIGGLAVGLAYHYGGGRSIEGNNVIIDEIHEPTAWVPRRMAPMVFIGTLVTQLFGGSAGREGTAIQMTGSLTDHASQLLRLGDHDRRIMLIAAIAGGFGAVFGVPIAGAVFALEVQAIGRVRYDAIVPCLTASTIGAWVVHALGVHHTPVPRLAHYELTLGLLGRVALAGVVFGLVGILAVELTHGLKRVFRVLVPWMPGRPVLGGVIIALLTLAVGAQTYNGLSLGLIHAALFGGDVSGWSWLLKLIFTAITLGALFQGGEVTPLFVIGATLGAVLAVPLGVPVTLLAAIGFVAVFAGATNTPIACTIMGLELFGGGGAIYFAIGCVVAFVCSSHRGIYAAQRVAIDERGRHIADVPLRHWRRGDPSGSAGAPPAS